MDPARKLATYADLCALPEQTRAEIHAGELVVHPAPLPEHGLAQRTIGRFIGGPFHDDDGRGGPGGWWILIEVDVRFGAHEILRPDIAGWRRARLPSPWGQRPIEVAPDWVCEVLSPATQRHDRVHKAAVYAAAGVGHYWLLDPAERLLEALALDAGRWVRLGAWDDTAAVAIPPFEQVELALARLLPPAADPSAADPSAAR